MTRDEFYKLLESGENVRILTDFLLEHPNQIDQLVDIALNDPRKGMWRAMWIIDKIHEKSPKLIRPHINRMIEAIESISDDSKLRHLLKIISLNKIPQQHLSFLLEYGINELTNAERPVAIRVHAMQILFEISKQEPDFKQELIQLIEHEMEYHATGGINSRGKRLLKKLYNFQE